MPPKKTKNDPPKASTNTRRNTGRRTTKKASSSSSTTHSGQSGSSASSGQYNDGGNSTTPAVTSSTPSCTAASGGQQSTASSASASSLSLLERCEETTKYDADDGDNDSDVTSEGSSMSEDDETTLQQQEEEEKKTADVEDEVKKLQEEAEQPLHELYSIWQQATGWQSESQGGTESSSSTAGKRCTSDQASRQKGVPKKATNRRSSAASAKQRSKRASTDQQNQIDNCRTVAATDKANGSTDHNTSEIAKVDKKTKGSRRGGKSKPQARGKAVRRKATNTLPHRELSEEEVQSLKEREKLAAERLHEIHTRRITPHFFPRYGCKGIFDVTQWNINDGANSINPIDQILPAEDAIFFVNTLSRCPKDYFHSIGAQDLLKRAADRICPSSSTLSSMSFLEFPEFCASDLYTLLCPLNYDARQEFEFEDFYFAEEATNDSTAQLSEATWSESQDEIKAQSSEDRPQKTHWDFLLGEMQWMAADFRDERTKKFNKSKRLAHSALSAYKKREKKNLAKARTLEVQRRRRANQISKAVLQHWRKIDKLVIWKHRSRLEAMRREAMDKHLAFLVGQTQKYTKMIAGDILGDTQQNDHQSRTKRPAENERADENSMHTRKRQKTKVARTKGPSSYRETPEQQTSGDVENESSSDEGFSDDSPEEDDEATLEEEEKLQKEEQRNNNESGLDEVSALQNDLETPIDQLREQYGYVPSSSSSSALQQEGKENGLVSGEEEDTNTSDNDINEDDSSNDEGFSDDSMEEDDEATLEEEEKLQQEEQENGNQPETDEISALQNDLEMTVEQLREQYGDGASSSSSVVKQEEQRNDVSEHGRGEDDSASSDSEFFSENSSDADDEATLEQEETVAKERGEDENDELEALKNDQEVPVEELREKYCNKASKSTEDNSSQNEITQGTLVRSENQLQPKSKFGIPFLLRNGHLLRGYQVEGLDWLMSLHDKRLNGILADEMGLGKTIQTIAMVAYLACYRAIWGPHLIVVPTSTILNWEMEFKRWCPALKVKTYFGSPQERKEKREGWTKPNAFHVCITSYQMAVRDSTIFRRKQWYYLILDEAHYIKNFKSQRWQTLLTLNSRRRLLLTGTPLQNNLIELWSLMHFLMPDLFRSQSEFKEWFSTPLTAHVEGVSQVDSGLITKLHSVLRPFVLRRLKKEVELQLPGKYEKVINCELSKRQRYLYEEYMSRSSTRATIDSGGFMSMMNVLMQLRKVCNHPDLFEPRPIQSPLHVDGINFGLAKCMLPPCARPISPSEATGFAGSALIASNWYWLGDVFHSTDNVIGGCYRETYELKSEMKLLNNELKNHHNEEFSLLAPGLRLHVPLVGYYIPQALQRRNRCISKICINSPAYISQPTDFPESVDIGSYGLCLSDLELQTIPRVAIDRMVELTPTEDMWSQNIADTDDEENMQEYVKGLIADIRRDDNPHAAFRHVLNTYSIDKSHTIAVAAAAGVDVRDISGSETQEQSGNIALSNEATLSRYEQVLKSVFSECKRRITVQKAGKVFGESERYTSLIAALGMVHSRSRIAKEKERSRSLRTINNKRIRSVGNLVFGEGTHRACFVGPRPIEENLLLHDGMWKAVPRMKIARRNDYEHFRPWDYSVCLRKMLWTVNERYGVLSLLLRKVKCYIPKVSAGSLRLQSDSMNNLTNFALAALYSSLKRSSIKRNRYEGDNKLAFPDKFLLQFDCGKLQQLDSLLRERKAGGHRCLIFTQMTRMLDILEIFLNFHGYMYLRLDGSTTVEERQRLMERFNEDERVFVFILSTRSGGLGVNLTGADSVIFYDSDWNPSMDTQAQDRAHRIGQTRDVTIYRLITSRTVEENILLKSRQKAEIARLSLQSGRFRGTESTEDATSEFSNMAVLGNSTDLRSIVTGDVSSSRQDGSQEHNETQVDKGNIVAAMEAVEEDVDVAAQKALKSEIEQNASEFDEKDTSEGGNHSSEEPSAVANNKSSDEHVHEEDDLLSGVKGITDVKVADSEGNETTGNKKGDRVAEAAARFQAIENKMTKCDRYALYHREKVDPHPYVAPEVLEEMESRFKLQEEAWELEQLRRIKEEEEFANRADLELLQLGDEQLDDKSRKEALARAVEKASQMYFNRLRDLRREERRRHLSGDIWCLLRDIDTGKFFYLNEDTNESSWARPRVLLRRDELFVSKCFGWAPLLGISSVAYRIMSFFEPAERLQLALVCKFWAAAARHPLFAHFVSVDRGVARKEDRDTFYKRHWDSLKEAVKCCLPGDTIVLSLGSHAVNDDIFVDKPLRILAEGATIVQGAERTNTSLSEWFLTTLGKWLHWNDLDKAGYDRGIPVFDSLSSHLDVKQGKKAMNSTLRNYAPQIQHLRFGEETGVSPGSVGVHIDQSSGGELVLASSSKTALLGTGERCLVRLEGGIHWQAAGGLIAGIALRNVSTTKVEGRSLHALVLEPCSRCDIVRCDIATASKSLSPVVCSNGTRSQQTTIRVVSSKLHGPFRPTGIHERNVSKCSGLIIEGPYCFASIHGSTIKHFGGCGINVLGSKVTMSVHRCCIQSNGDCGIRISPFQSLPEDKSKGMALVEQSLLVDNRNNSFDIDSNVKLVCLENDFPTVSSLVHDTPVSLTKRDISTLKQNAAEDCEFFLLTRWTDMGSKAGLSENPRVTSKDLRLRLVPGKNLTSRSQPPVPVLQQILDILNKDVSVSGKRSSSVLQNTQKSNKFARQG